MSLNAALLSEVKEHILAHPETFDMNDWLACIAGHIVLMHDGTLEPYEADISGFALQVRATEILGVPFDRAHWLFVSLTPEDYDGFLVPGTAEYTRSYARAIDQFIADYAGVQ